MSAEVQAWWRTDTLAAKFFLARIAYSNAEEQMSEALDAACGLADCEPDDYPYEDITYDSYDTSFEFKGIKGDWMPTLLQIAVCWELGFSRCWLCYDDGSERFCSPEWGIGKRLPSPSARVVEDAQEIRPHLFYLIPWMVIVGLAYGAVAHWLALLLIIPPSVYFGLWLQRQIEAANQRKDSNHER